MSAAKVTGWPGFQYQPVYAVQARLAARQLRVARNNIRRLLETMGLKYADLADRLRALRKDSRLNTEQKRNQFQTILDIYAKRIIAGTATSAATEAAPVQTAGSADVGVPVDENRDGDGTPVGAAE